MPIFYLKYDTCYILRYIRNVFVSQTLTHSINDNDSFNHCKPGQVTEIWRCSGAITEVPYIVSVSFCNTGTTSRSIASISCVDIIWELPLHDFKTKYLV